jgi:hypothetical protein
VQCPITTAQGLGTATTTCQVSTTIPELAKTPKSKSLNKCIVSSKTKSRRLVKVIINAELAKPLAYVAVLPLATWGRNPFPQILFQAPWQQYSPAKGIREGKPLLSTYIGVPTLILVQEKYFFDIFSEEIKEA